MHMIKSGGLSHREAIPVSTSGSSDTHDVTMDIHLRMVSSSSALEPRFTLELL